MQIKKHKFFSQKLSFLASVFALFASIANIFALILLTSNNSTFAAPGAGGTPTTVSFALDAMSVDFHFTPAELSASTFKQDNINAPISTNNPTGFTFYVSSIDDDTNLNHTDSSVTTKITSITSPLVESNFTPKSWGYSADGVNFKPIPKASTPDTVLATTTSSGQRARVNFGVKASPDLNSGTYSKQVLFTAVTNRTPTTATFLPGPEFNNYLADLNCRVDAKGFKKATSLTVNVADATIVSSTDSERPIYIWYDSTENLIYWWSDADVVYANENSKSMFASLFRCASGSTPKSGASRLIDFVDVSDINMSRVKDMSYMFYGSKYKTIKEKILGDFDTSNVENMSHMFENSYDSDSTPQTPIDFSRFNTSKVKDMSSMFKRSQLPSIDLRGLDTSNVENMEEMFNGMRNTVSVNLANLDVRKVSNMDSLFSHSAALQTLDVSNWKNDLITNMNYMFNGLTSLTNINIDGFTTNHVTSMAYMFGDVKSLQSLDLRSFDTSNVNNIQGMFYGMNSLTHLDVSSFNTSKVNSLFFTFNGLSSIEELDLSSFDTSNVEDMQYTFKDLKKIHNLNLSSFDTRKVVLTSYAFENLMSEAKNGTLDLSSFDTKSLAGTLFMFLGAKVKTIYVSPNFVTTRVTVSTGTFGNCTNLIGGNGTTFSTSNPTDKTYARIDAQGTPGYFTLKP